MNDDPEPQFPDLYPYGPKWEAFLVAYRAWEQRRYPILIVMGALQPGLPWATHEMFHAEPTPKV